MAESRVASPKRTGLDAQSTLPTIADTVSKAKAQKQAKHITLILIERKNLSLCVISLASKIFAKHGIGIVTYHQSFKGQGD